KEHHRFGVFGVLDSLGREKEDGRMESRSENGRQGRQRRFRSASELRQSKHGGVGDFFVVHLHGANNLRKEFVRRMIELSNAKESIAEGDFRRRAIQYLLENGYGVRPDSRKDFR